MGPIVESVQESSYEGVPPLLGFGMNAPVCQKGQKRYQRAPIGLKEYNTTAQRAAYDKFNEITSKPQFNESFFIFEGYAIQGVKAVPDESTAVGDRQDNLLM
jgi:hypothetical protein